MATEFLSKLPPNFLDHDLKVRLKKMGIFTPMNIFLSQEIDHMQHLITMVRQTLSDILLTIEGTLSRSDTIHTTIDNVFHSHVPKLWSAVSWPAASISIWFVELLERYAQYSTWLFVGRPNAFWLAGFFNPRGFLTAMKQENTKMHKGDFVMLVCSFHSVLSLVMPLLNAFNLICI